MAEAMHELSPGRERPGSQPAATSWRALVDPDDPEAQQARIRAYTNEGHDLYEAKAWRTMAKLFDTVRPAVAEIAAQEQGRARRWSWCRGRTGTTRTP